MSNAQDGAKKLSALLRKIGGRTPEAGTGLEDDDPVGVLVMSFLLWECTAPRAATAFKRIHDHIVDYNDLRVTMSHEIAEWIGARYPNAAERCQRLRAALRHTYKREHAVSLDRLKGMGRREVKRYMRSLDGIAPYVADRVTLLCFDAHCVPVDERLRRALIGAGVADESTDVNDLASWLARHVKAADAVAAHHALQAWSDETASASGPRRGRRGSTRGAKTRAR